MRTLPRPWARRLLVLVTILIVWFTLLGHRDLFDPDEGRYAEIPREMVESGDWLTPRLQGLKYFEKPPLQYWTTAIALQVLGVTSAAARLSTAVMGLAGMLWIWWVAARLWGRHVADLALLIGSSGLLYFVMGHVITLDMSLTFFLTLGLGSLLVAQQERERPAVERNWMLLAWAALAGAVLCKGLVGLVLPAGAVAVYVLWQRDWALLRHLHLVKGLLLLAGFCAPWFVAVSLANDDFASFFFIHEHFERFTTTVHRRDGPLYYFVGIFLLGALPWVALAVVSLARPGFSWRGGVKRFEADRMCWVYVVVVLVFFSVSQSKLPAYILPVWPFVALLAARQASGLVRLRADAWITMAAALSLALSVLLLPNFASDNTSAELLQGLRPWIAGAAAFLLVAGCVLLLWRRSLKSGVAVAALAAMMSVQMLLWGAQELSPSRSGHATAQRIKQLALPADAPVYLIGIYSPSLAFYLQRKAHVVEYEGELRFGLDAEPQRAIRSPETFARRWRADPNAVAVVSTRRHSQYLGLGLPMQRIGAGPGQSVLVVKPTAVATTHE